MGVDQRVVDWLREQGVAHLRDEGLHRMADEDVFAKAIAEDRIVLTFDLDFGEIAALSRGRKASVVLFRLHNTRTPHVIDRLVAAATAASGMTRRVCIRRRSLHQRPRGLLSPLSPCPRAHTVLSRRRLS